MSESMDVSTKSINQSMSIRLNVKTNAEVNVTRNLPTDFLITHIHEITIRLDKADIIHKMSDIVFSLNKIIMSTN